MCGVRVAHFSVELNFKAFLTSYRGSRGNTGTKSCHKVEVDEEETMFEYTTESSNSLLGAPSRRQKKRQRQDDYGSLATRELVHSIQKRNQKSDPCSVYGQYVSQALSLLDDGTSNIVQHKINDLIFQAHMGYLDPHAAHPC